MKRELKEPQPIPAKPGLIGIARPIPMKRELKVVMNPAMPTDFPQYCKAHPDEKGTERELQALDGSTNKVELQGPSR